MGKYTRQVWMERGGWVSVNGEAREGARCEMLDDKGGSGIVEVDVI